MSRSEEARLNTALEGLYRVERRLGEGGMATVYLAADLRHERLVALKVLKAELAAVVGAQRFLSEIKTTANLQHPHILPLFDSGEADGLLFYVMPYVEGETLRDRLDRERQLPVDEAVQMATKVAGALQVAHERGVIHRDVKPANILLAGGEPMVSDFGIALAVGVAGHTRLTETGLSVGTPHYMSPEQATGDQAVGAASDIYALGCVLYEALTGEPPFTGTTAQAILGKIIIGSPAPVSRSRRTVPSHVESAIRKALERIPADRFASAADFARALNNPGFRLRSATPGAPSRYRAATLAVLALVAGVAIGRWAVPSPAGPDPVIRYQAVIEEFEGVSQTLRYTLAVSHDGSRIAYVAGSADAAQVWIRERDELSSRPVRGTEGAVSPFFSPEGDRIGFVDRSGALRVTSVVGGEPLTLLESGVGQRGAAWGEDGYIYFSAVQRPGLTRVAAAGGTPAESVYRRDVDTGLVAHARPWVLPGGRGVIVTVARSNEPDRIGVVDVDSGELTDLVDGTIGVYATSGHLVFAAADGSLLAAPFDERSLRLTDTPVLVEELGPGVHSLALSDRGRLVYTAIGTDADEAVWVDSDGVDAPIDADSPVRGVGSLALSADGTRLAVDIPIDPRRAGSHIWVKELPAGPLFRLTLEGDDNLRPEWFAGGDSILYISERDGDRAIWKKSADGTGAAELMHDDERPIEQARVSSDGQWLVYRTGSNPGERDIFAVRRGDGQEPIPLAVDEFDELAPALSPDGRWLAYSAFLDGQWDVYVQPFPVGDARWRVSRSGGFAPLWSADGRRLYFQSQADVQLVVDVLDGDPVRFGPEEVLFPMGLRWMGISHRRYDLAPGDDRFVMVRARTSDIREEELFVVENFLAVLRSRLAR